MDILAVTWHLSILWGLNQTPTMLPYLPTWISGWQDQNNSFFPLLQYVPTYSQLWWSAMLEDVHRTPFNHMVSEEGCLMGSEELFSPANGVGYLEIARCPGCWLFHSAALPAASPSMTCFCLDDPSASLPIWEKTKFATYPRKWRW